MTYRKELTIVTAEADDIEKGTEFYLKDDVDAMINDIENEVNEIQSYIEDYKEWTVDDLINNLDIIYEKLKKLSNNLY